MFEYAAKILAMGDDQQARKAKIELPKALNQGSASDNICQPSLVSVSVRLDPQLHKHWIDGAALQKQHWGW